MNTKGGLRLKALTGALMAGLLSVTLLTGCDADEYKRGQELLQAGSYEEASQVFEALGDYKDSAQMAEQCKTEQARDLYNQAEKLYGSEDYEGAMNLYHQVQELGGYGAVDRMIAACEKAINRRDFASVYGAIDGQTWYAGGASTAELKCVSFSGDTATVSSVTNGGNGTTSSSAASYPWQVDGEKVSLGDASTPSLTIAYTQEGDAVKPSGYLTEQQVKDGLQGFWQERSSTQACVYQVKPDVVSAESGSKSAVRGVDYFYSAPEDLGYTFKDGELQWSQSGVPGTFFCLGVGIQGGEPVLLNAGRVLSRCDGFLGQDGYAFLA